MLKKAMLSLVAASAIFLASAPTFAATSTGGYEPGPTPYTVTASEADPIPPL